MNPTKLTLAAFALTAAGITSAKAELDHNDVFSCYAYVHEQCYPGGGESQCGEGAYEDALDECDGYYEESGKRPATPTSFATRTNPQLLMKIKQSFKQPR